MKKFLIAAVLASCALGASGATTIDPNHKDAYGANIAWINWQGDVLNGAVVTEDILAGLIWSANCGWIYLGDGSPDNGPQYQNNSAADFGVNLDAAGNLSGFAYGANIGWLNFHPLGVPKIDLLTGNFSGYIWSANCGWISLSNQFAYVKTTVILPAMDSDHDGLPDSWELRFARSLDVLDGRGDPDHDGVSNLDEALAGTNPLDRSDALRITSFARGSDGKCDIQWNSQPTRLYRVLGKSALLPTAAWQDIGLGLIQPSPNTETAVQFPSPRGAHSFFQIEAIKPLTP